MPPGLPQAVVGDAQDPAESFASLDRGGQVWLPILILKAPHVADDGADSTEQALLAALDAEGDATMTAA
jgi:hypothetical protein